jgi:catalase-peroxidase
MGLIYVNPEGVNGNPDPARTALHVRETFARMAMNDEETAALTCGGHTVGKAMAAATLTISAPNRKRRASKRRASAGPTRARNGKAANAFTSGIEGAWTSTRPSGTWAISTMLFDYEWELKKSRPAPGSGNRSTCRKRTSRSMRPIPSIRHNPMMTDADMAMKVDPIYNEICQKFRADPEYFADTFARAWFKLTHRDMGPKANYSARTCPPKT